MVQMNSFFDNYFKENIFRIITHNITTKENIITNQIVRIMIDENSYPTESLMDPSVAPLQGPALVFCNDSKFSESDFWSLALLELDKGQNSRNCLQQVDLVWVSTVSTT